MNEILAFMLDFSVPLGALLALSLVYARGRDARPYAHAARRTRRH